MMQQIYEITKSPNFAKEFRLRDQLIGAGISIMNNMAEGFDSQSNAEFIRFLRYSRRSTSEVQNCLYIGYDQNYVSKKELAQVYEQAKKVRKTIQNSILCGLL